MKAAWECTTRSFPMNCFTRPACSKNGSASRRYTRRCSRSATTEARSSPHVAGPQRHAFRTGPNPDTDLTDRQILDQCKMYIAALRIADDFGCDAIGIQYQQGLKDLAPASDLVEGPLNNVDRPPVTRRGNGRVLFEGEALPHFNEVDECAGLDGLVTNRLWTKLGFPPENTLHDLRWGEDLQRPVCVGVRDLRRRPARSFQGRLQRSRRRTSATDVFPPAAVPR